MRNGQLLWERCDKGVAFQKPGLYPAKRNWPLILKRMDLPELVTRPKRKPLWSGLPEASRRKELLPQNCSEPWNREALNRWKRGPWITVGTGLSWHLWKVQQQWPCLEFHLGWAADGAGLPGSGSKESSFLYPTESILDQYAMVSVSSQIFLCRLIHERNVVRA